MLRYSHMLGSVVLNDKLAVCVGEGEAPGSGEEEASDCQGDHTQAGGAAHGGARLLQGPTRYVPVPSNPWQPSVDKSQSTELT